MRIIITAFVSLSEYTTFHRDIRHTGTEGEDVRIQLFARDHDEEERCDLVRVSRKSLRSGIASQVEFVLLFQSL